MLASTCPYRDNTSSFYVMVHPQDGFPPAPLDRNAESDPEPEPANSFERGLLPGACFASAHSHSVVGAGQMR
jgi:hypothetical protein